MQGGYARAWSCPYCATTSPPLISAFFLAYVLAIFAVVGVEVLHLLRDELLFVLREVGTLPFLQHRCSLVALRHTCALCSTLLEKTPFSPNPWHWATTLPSPLPLSPSFSLCVDQLCSEALLGFKTISPLGSQGGNSFRVEILTDNVVRVAARCTEFIDEANAILQKLIADTEKTMSPLTKQVFVGTFLSTLSLCCHFSHLLFLQLLLSPRCSSLALFSMGRGCRM